MKTRQDPRHQQRIHLMQQLFSWDANPKSNYPEVNEIITNLDKIDTKIQNSAPERPIGQINKVDLAILRLAFFELLLKEGTPPKVVVDEAVELGKEYGSDSSAAFINGVLGKIIESEGIKT